MIFDDYAFFEAKQIILFFKKLIVSSARIIKAFSFRYLMILRASFPFLSADLKPPLA
jgi:hypothetical protein